jgi:hypothetical protein
MPLDPGHRTSSFLLLLLVAFFLSGGCKIRVHEQEGLVFGDPVEGNGVVVEEERSVPEFEDLRNEGDTEVILQPGDGPLRVQADSNLIPLVKTEVRRKTLSVQLEERVLTSKSLKVFVPIGKLFSIRNEGSGTVRSGDRIRWNDLTVENDGSGDIDLHLSAESLTYRGNGSGDARFEGKAEQFSIENHGSGDVMAAELQARKVDCRSNGSGDVHLDAMVELKIETVGSGDVLYDRAPPNIRVESSGPGEVEKIGD